MKPRFITVRIRNVYGKELIYPVCQDALTFAKLTGKKTLDQNDIAMIKSLGYIIDIESQKL